MSIPMPITFLNVPELIDYLPQTDVKKEPYKKENRLDRLSLQYAKSNEDKDKIKLTIIDLSLKNIFEKIISTISSIIEDLLDLNEYSIRKIVKVFIEGDRMVYFGIFVVTIAIILFIIGISS